MVEQILAGQGDGWMGGEGGWYQWKGGDGRERLWKGEYGTNTVLHVYVNVKMICVETFPGMRGRSDKESGRWGEIKYDIFDML
jgi:hypothetical protein